jgi:hypothetical protein
MEKTLKVLNELEKAGLVSKYAIGGSIAVLFHAEPVLTYDMDIYCFLPAQTGRLVTLSPIYGFLKKQGYREDKEHVLIEGVPVQFVPAYNDLVTAAVTEAVETKFKRTRTRVVQVEYLLRSCCRPTGQKIAPASRTCWTRRRLTRASWLGY